MALTFEGSGDTFNVKIFVRRLPSLAKGTRGMKSRKATTRNRRYAITKKSSRAAPARIPKKYLERWWLKYEAAGDLDAEFPTPPEMVFDMLNSVHAHWRGQGNVALNMKEDLRHHTAVQKVFKKWREVYGERV